ncbi:unnamed protein product [Closterium sp. Yama58-4]|nr:unnamed protein product [Closterium sp. Yama58-4]
MAPFPFSSAHRTSRLPHPLLNPQVLPMVLFSIALFAFYSLTPLMLRLGGAALFNLSLLTSDLWAAGVAALVFNQPVSLRFRVFET